MADVVEERKKQEPKELPGSILVLSYSIVTRLFAFTVCYSVVHLKGQLVNFS